MEIPKCFVLMAKPVHGPLLLVNASVPTKIERLRIYSFVSYTVNIRNPDRQVYSCPIVEWSGFRMVTSLDCFINKGS